MSKWMKVDPATLKVGDRFKAVKIRGDHSKIVATGVVEDNDFECFGIRQGQPPAALHPLLYDTTSCHWFIDNYQWYIRSNEPKKAKPEPDLVEGHDAKFWFCRWEKQLNHNEQLQAANSGRRVKMQRLEKEVKDARKDAQYWQNKYAVLAASTNETQAQLDDAMLTIAEKNTELANLRKVLAQAQNSNSPSNVNPLAAFYRPYRNRPDEPPVGSFFRVDRTGELYLRMHEGNGDYGYVSLLGDREGDLCTWTDITDHGDTITRLLLVEATDD